MKVYSARAHSNKEKIESKSDKRGSEKKNKEKMFKNTKDKNSERFKGNEMKITPWWRFETLKLIFGEVTSN